MANPYFNAAYYLQNNPDVQAAGYTELNAESHYLQYGANEALLGVTSRKPAPYFDVSYYLLGNPDLIVAGLGPADAFQHFVQYGQFEQRSPAAGLTITDAKLSDYAANNPDLREAFSIEDSSNLSQEQKDALTSHFYRYGYQEDRPGAPFDPYHPPGPGPDPTPDPDPNYLFTLTPETDTFKGGSADDMFQGLASHLNLFDNLDGGGGHNTLKLLADSPEVDLLMVPHTTIPATVTIKNIQTVELYVNNEGAAPYSLIDASRFQGATEIWQIEGVGDIKNLKDGQVAGFRDVAFLDELSLGVVAYNDSAKNAAIVFDNDVIYPIDSAEDDGPFGMITAIEVAGTGLNTISVAGTLATIAIPDDADLETVIGEEVFSEDEALFFEEGPFSGYDSLGFLLLNLSNAGGDAGMQTLNLALTTNTFLFVLEEHESIQTINASASTGGLITMLALNPEISANPLQSFTSGSGNDLVYATPWLFANDVTIATGEGDDTVLVYLDSLLDEDEPDAEIADITMSVSGGAGENEFIFQGGNIVVNDGGNGFVGSVVITDFNDGENLLVLGPWFDGFTDQETVDDAIVDAATLFDAVMAVAAVIGTGEPGITDYAQFVFEGNTYVYGDVYGDNDHIDPDISGDVLIQLTGRVELDDTNVVGGWPCGCGAPT